MPNPTNDGAHLRPLAEALRRFRLAIDASTRPHPDGREVVYPGLLREAADDVSNAFGTSTRVEWARHGTTEADASGSSGTMAFGRGRGAPQALYGLTIDVVNIVAHTPGVPPAERWPEGYVFDTETLAALDRTEAAVGSMQAAVTVEAGDAGIGKPTPEAFAFKDAHLTLLAELAGHNRLVKATELDGLSGMPPIDKIYNLFAELERAGFVRRPSGPRSGYGITADGRAELSRRNMLPD
jgi:hypothetical protein